VIALMAVLEIIGLVLAVRAFRRRRPAVGCLVLAALALAATGLVFFEFSPSNPDTVGRSAAKPAGLNTPVRVEHLTLVVPKVWTSQRVTQTAVAVDARTLGIAVQVSCDLAPGETCATSNYHWRLSGLKSTLSLWPSQPMYEIAGGETVEIELATGWEFYDTTSFQGARLEFSMRERAWERLHSAYFDLGINQP
jgi:hypothetical protein